LTKEKKTILHEFCNNFFVDFSNRAINFDEDTRSRRSSSSANVARPFTNDVNDAASALLLVSRLNDKSRTKPKTNLSSKKKASRDAEQSTESVAPPMPLTSSYAEQSSKESESPMLLTSRGDAEQQNIMRSKTKMVVRGRVTNDIN
jgi:hypothetical protein